MYLTVTRDWEGVIESGIGIRNHKTTDTLPACLRVIIIHDNHRITPMLKDA